MVIFHSYVSSPEGIDYYYCVFVQKNVVHPKIRPFPFGDGDIFSTGQETEIESSGERKPSAGNHTKNYNHYNH